MQHSHFRQRLLAVALLAATSAGAGADGLSYDYLEVRYAETEVDSSFGDIEGDGIVLNGLVELAGPVHLLVGYDRLEFDDGIDVRTTVFGGGIAFNVAPTTDIVLRAGFVDGRISDDFFEDEDDGFFVSAGARSLLTDDIELYGEFRSIDFDRLGEEESMQIGLDFYLSNGLAVGPNITWVEDTTTWSLGAKFYF